MEHFTLVDRSSLSVELTILNASRANIEMLNDLRKNVSVGDYELHFRQLSREARTSRGSVVFLNSGVIFQSLLLSLDTESR